MHGGASGSGAPKGNENALKHGTYTRGAFEERANFNKQVEEVRNLLEQLNANCRNAPK
jgi:uncharacterized protein YjcR